MHLFLALLLACGPRSAAPPAGPASAAPAPAPTASEHLPTPFTADRIREAMPAGTTITLLVEEHASPPIRNRLTVLEADENTVRIEFVATDSAGEVVHGPIEETERWEDLRDHARFPAATTERLEAVLDSPLGRFDTWVYRVRDEAAVVTEYHFAKDLPGPPLLLTITGGGMELARVTQVERTRP